MAEIVTSLRRGIDAEIIIDRAGLADLLPRPRAGEMLCHAESSEGSEKAVGSITSSDPAIPTAIVVKQMN